MEFQCGNIFVRTSPRLLRRGYVIEGHHHNFDHMSLVMSGSVHVEVTNDAGEQLIKQDFIKGDHFLVKAEHHHTITSLEDGTQFYCIYSHRTPQGEVSQVDTGWREAYL